MNFIELKKLLRNLGMLLVLTNLAVGSCSKSKNSSESSGEEAAIDWDNVEDGVDEDWLDKYKSDVEPPPSPVAEEVELSTAEKLENGVRLYVANCSSCHGEISISTKRNRSAKSITNSISQVLTMSAIESLTVLTQEEIGFIEYAIDDRNNPDFKSIIPVGLTFEARALVGNRKFIASSLKTVFGGENQQPLFDVIDNNITQNVTFFGGPCGPKSSDCSSPASGAKMLPASNVARSGYLIKTCNSLIATDQAITNMLTNAGLVDSSPAGDTSMRKLFSLFYPTLTPSATAMESAKALHGLVGKQSSREINSWRYVGYSLCSSIALEMI